MRIAAYVHGYLPHLPAGSETMLHEMILALGEAGHDTKVFTVNHPQRNTSWKWEGVPVTNRTTETAADLQVAAWRPDVIVSHHAIAVRAIPLAAELGAASAVIVHNDFHLSQALAKAGPGLLVANTQWVANKLNRPHHQVKAIVVHPPVDPAKHRTEPGDMIGMINFYAMKNPHLFWRLALRFPDYKFLAVKGAYGHQELRSLPNVEVIEPTTDMRADVWSRLRVLLVPSKYESYGKGPVEAAASGIPSLAAPTPGLREALGHGATFCPRINGRAWEDALAALMEDPAAWAAASAAALARSAEIEAGRGAEMARWVDAIEALPLPE